MSNLIGVLVRSVSSDVNRDIDGDMNRDILTHDFPSGFNPCYEDALWTSH